MTATPAMPVAAVRSAVLVLGGCAVVRVGWRGRWRLVVRLRLTGPGPGPGLGARPRWWQRLADVAGDGAVIVPPPFDQPAVGWTWAGLAVGGPLLMLGVAGPALAALVAVVAAGVPVVGLRWAGARARARYRAALPLALEEVARSLRSGTSLVLALGEAAAADGPAAADLRCVVSDTALYSIVVALERWADHRPDPEVRLAAAALAMGVETGGAAAQAVDGVAAGLRQRLTAAAEASAAGAQARLSALVIAAAPVGFAVVVGATDPTATGFLFRTRTGLVFLVAGLTLDGLGAWWMARVTRGAG